jgi:hypothetical protein
MMNIVDGDLFGRFFILMSSPFPQLRFRILRERF